jgi:hypothetical protein
MLFSRDTSILISLFETIVSWLRLDSVGVPRPDRRVLARWWGRGIGTGIGGVRDGLEVSLPKREIICSYCFHFHSI